MQIIVVVSAQLLGSTYSLTNHISLLSLLVQKDLTKMDFFFYTILSLHASVGHGDKGLQLFLMFSLFLKSDSKK